MTEEKLAKPWYKKWWGLILTFSFFPLVVPYLVWTKTTWKKWIKITITVICFLLLISSLSDSNEAIESVSQNNNENKITEKENQEKIEIQEQANIEKKPITIIDKLWSSFDNSIKKREGYNIKYNEESKTVTLIYNSETFWDESSLLRGAYSSLVKYGLEAFELEDVDALTIKYKTEFTDSYGKKSSEDAVILTMSKEEFSKYEWKGLEYQPIHNQMKNSCLEHYIHPAILKNLKYESLHLSL